MISKLTFDNGRIRSGFDSFNCDDEGDMERLCDRCNEVFSELLIEKEKATNQLRLIRQVMGVNQE